MASRGRKPGFKMGPDHRSKIKNSGILNALIEHVQGKRDMSSTQVTAGIALMKKVMPDLQATTIDATVKRAAYEYTDAELIDIIAAGSGKRPSGKANGKAEPDSVH